MGSEYLTDRIPLKIRNREESERGNQGDKERIVKTEYDFTKKKEGDFENSREPLHNKIITKLTEK